MSAQVSSFLPDEAATERLGAALAQHVTGWLPQGRALCVYLEGDLGAGKTALTRAVLNALGTPAEDNATAAMSSLTYGRTYSPTVGGATFEDWLPCAGVRLNTGIVKNIGKFGMIWNAGSTSWQWCGTTESNVKVVSAGSNSQAHTAALSVRCRKM